MGFTSSFRMGQLLQYVFKSPEHCSDLSDFKFMTTNFIDEVRRCLKDGGFATKKEEQESGGTFLVGYHGHLYQIAGDYQVAENVLHYDACGCGADIALGSLYSTVGSPTKRLETALKAAEQFSAGVRGPFHYISSVEK